VPVGMVSVDIAGLCLHKQEHRIYYIVGCTCRMDSVVPVVE
jgi:hypothetical protein